MFIKGAQLFGFFGAASAACSGTRGESFQDAAEAVCRIEEMVNEYVETLETRYADINSDEGLDEDGNLLEGFSNSCVGGNYPGVESCSPNSNVWQERSYDYDAQFTNWETKTCTRFDKDENNQFLAEPKTGRISSCEKATECREDASDECAKYPYFEPGTYKQDGSQECRCNYQTVFEDDGEWIEHNGIESKPDYLTKTGCTDSTQYAGPDDGGICSVSKSKFGISLPEGTSVNDRRVSSEICGTNTLINDFQDNADANPDTNWHYMGFQKSGMYRIWPSVYECRTEAQCAGCSDPRYRTWYANAASGPKDVVLVLDDSGSMNTNNRIGKMKEAAKWVISTLGPNDYVSIVKFTNSAESATENLIPATIENRAELKNYIDTNFNANGGTNMGDGLEKAFDIISDSRVARQSAFCEKIILFLTDGENSNLDKDPEQVIRERNTNDLNVRMFTYSFGDEAETEVMKRIACEHNGVWQQISDTGGDDLKTIMAGYFTIMAAGVAESGIRWAHWYEDGEGLGQQGGPCKAVYDRYKQEKEGVPVMFGVTCVGISRAMWEALPGNENAWKDILEQNEQCADTSFLTEEAMEILRGSIDPRSVCSNNNWYDDLTEEEEQAIGLVVGVVVILVLLFGGLCAWKVCCSGGSGSSKIVTHVPAVAPVPTPQVTAPVPQGQVVAVY